MYLYEIFFPHCRFVPVFSLSGVLACFFFTKEQANLLCLRECWPSFFCIVDFWYVEFGGFGFIFSQHFHGVFNSANKSFQSSFSRCQSSSLILEFIAYQQEEVLDLCCSSVSGCGERLGYTSVTCLLHVCNLMLKFRHVQGSVVLKRLFNTFCMFLTTLNCKNFFLFLILCSPKRSSPRFCFQARNLPINQKVFSQQYAKPCSMLVFCNSKKNYNFLR